MKCPICKWPLEDHHKRIVYDHARDVPVMIKKRGVIFLCRWCRQVYTILRRTLDISYGMSDPLCKKL